MCTVSTYCEVMGNVLIHSTITLDGFMADPDGGVDWMFGFSVADEDQAVVDNVMGELGAVVGGANKTQTIENDEQPYGGMLKEYRTAVSVTEGGARWDFSTTSRPS